VAKDQRFTRSDESGEGAIRLDPPDAAAEHPAVFAVGATKTVFNLKRDAGRHGRAVCLDEAVAVGRVNTLYPAVA
jgi:hypothetical protein